MSLEQEKAEGLAAATLKNDPAFSRAIALARQKIIEQWTTAPTTEMREALWHRWHAVTEVLDQLDVVEGRGHLAQAATKSGTPNPRNAPRP